MAAGGPIYDRPMLAITRPHGTIYLRRLHMGKLFFNILATFAEFEAALIRMGTREGMIIARARGNCAASSPNCPTDSRGNSAACMPRASILSAISPSSSPSQDQPSIAHSTGVIPLSVRSCPLPDSTRT